MLARSILAPIVPAIVVVVPTVLFYVVDITPFRRGFFCDDYSIRYPYKDSTVSDAMVYGILITTGVVIMVVNEIVRSYKEFDSTEYDLNIFGWRVPRYFQNIYSYIYVFLIGISITDVTTNFLKYTVGRLRPHFLEVCQPDFTCTTAVDALEYIENYTCTGEDVDRITTARLSFPSGHSSAAAYMSLFIIVYIHRRMFYPTLATFRGFLQWILFFLGAYTCISRIQDYKHHPTDVIAGALVGIVTCIVMFCTFSHFVEDEAKTKEKGTGPCV